MNKTEQRQIAIQSARSYLRHIGINPINVTANEALGALEDIQYSSPNTIAADFIASISESQINLFCRDWNTWKKAY